MIHVTWSTLRGWLLYLFNVSDWSATRWLVSSIPWRKERITREGVRSRWVFLLPPTTATPTEFLVFRSPVWSRRLSTRRWGPVERKEHWLSWRRGRRWLVWGGERGKRGEGGRRGRRRGSEGVEATMAKVMLCLYFKEALMSSYVISGDKSSPNLPGHDVYQKFFFYFLLFWFLTISGSFLGSFSIKQRISLPRN